MAFIGDLVVKLVADDQAGNWELMQPFGFTSKVSGKTHTARTGFRTDFCSVPRVPGVYEMLGNRARKAGTIHDSLYTTHEVPRDVADAVLREMLIEDGVDECEAEEFYVAVRSFGGSHWG